MNASATRPDYALLDRLGVAAGIFFPRPDFTSAPDGASDHIIEINSSATVAARFFAADKAFPTVLYFHGNGEVASDYDGFAPFFHAIELNLFVADFRGYGASKGTPTFDGLVYDAQIVAERFHELLDGDGFSDTRFVMGRSLGTHPALELSANAADRIAGLIVESGAASLERLARMAGSGDNAAEIEALVQAHNAKVAGISLPTLILHGERDELIPLERAAELHAALGSAEKELVVIPGAGHNDIFFVGRNVYMPSISAFVQRNS